MSWIVCYTIPAETQDDGIERERIIAAFEYQKDAQDFVDFCMSSETRSRFYVRQV